MYRAASVQIWTDVPIQFYRNLFVNCVTRNEYEFHMNCDMILLGTLMRNFNKNHLILVYLKCENVELVVSMTAKCRLYATRKLILFSYAQIMNVCYNILELFWKMSTINVEINSQILYDRFFVRNFNTTDKLIVSYVEFNGNIIGCENRAKIWQLILGG